jgi:hypothetical protein
VVGILSGQPGIAVVATVKYPAAGFGAGTLFATSGSGCPLIKICKVDGYGARSLSTIESAGWIWIDPE